MSSNENISYFTSDQDDENESTKELETKVLTSSNGSKQSPDELCSEDISLTNVSIPLPLRGDNDITLTEDSQQSQFDRTDGLSCSSKIWNFFGCGLSCWKMTESYESEQYPYPFRFLELIFTLGSLALFFYDVITDIMLACEYYALERWAAFGFTVAFIVIPIFVVNLTSLLWYGIDFFRERRAHLQTSRLVWFFRVIFTFPLLMGPVVRHIEYIYHGCKFRCSWTREEKRRHHYTAMLRENKDAGMMRMFEAFLESAPQLVLQLYIMLTETSDEGLLMREMRAAAMIGSWIGVSWSLVSYDKARRASRNEIGLSFFGTIIYYIWRACEVGPRILVLALFASHCTYWMVGVVAVHWIIMFAWVIKQNPKLCKEPCDKIVFNLLICFVMVFCFQNVHSGRTRFRQLVYYIVFYAENIVMLVLWSIFTSSKSEWYYFTAIAIVPGAMLLHICVQMIYYRCFHPKRQHEVEQDTTPENIEY